MPEFNIHPTLIASIQEMIDNSRYAIKGEELVLANQTGKEQIMPVFHFINEYNKGEDKFTFRTITTDFKNFDEAVGYIGSQMKRAPFDGVFAIESGNYIPRFLIEAAKTGVKFRVTIVRNDELVQMGLDIRKKVEENNFAWASASYTYFIKFPGTIAWGLEPIGIRMKFSKKLAKRLQEPVRLTAHSLYYSPLESHKVFFTNAKLIEGLHIETYGRPMGADLVVAKFETPEGMQDELFDGMNYMSPRMCEMLGFEGERGQVRFSFDEGVIKGDFIKSEHLGGADFVYHTENLKDDTWTDGRIIITVENHEAVHGAAYDVQSVTNNPTTMMAQTQLNDLNSMIAGLTNIIETGTLPEWLLKAERAHEEGLGWVQMEQASDVQMKGHERWGQYFPMRASQNFTYMGITGGVKKMETGKHLPTGLFKKTYIPMSNAVSVGVVTYSSMTLMGGFTLENTGRVEMVMGAGAVFPDHRFLDTFDLHGTWDQDDTVKLQLVKIWSSSAKAIENLREDMVIDSKIEIPRNESEAIEAVVAIRSPNGPGEYSIEFVGNMGFMNVTEEVGVVNLAMCPRGQSFLLSQVEMSGLPKDNTVPYSDEYTRDNAVYMLEAQAMNPGIGALANAMMCWVNVMGVSFPPKMAQVFGEMVDAVQQGFCKEQLDVVRLESARVYGQLINAMKNNSTLVIDRDMYFTRMPELLRGEIAPANVVTDQRMTQINARYTKAINDLKELAKVETMTARNESDLAKLIGSLEIPANVMGAVKKFVETNEKVLKGIDRKYDTKRDRNPFVKLMKNHLKTVSMKAAVMVMVESVKNIESLKERDQFVVGLYKHMLIPTRMNNLGGFDRIIFQQGENIALMDLLIEVLVRRGKI